MKILIAICFPALGSGSGTLVTAQAAAYVKAGHKVHMILGHCREDFPRVKGVEYHLVPFTAEQNPVIMKGQLPFNFPVFTTHGDTRNSFWSMGEKELGKYLLAFQNTLSEVVLSADPDIIHAQHNWLLSEQCTHFHKPVVTTVHGTDLQAYMRSHEELNLVNQKLGLLDGAEEHKAERAQLLEKKRIYELYLTMAEESARRTDCLIAISREQQELCCRLFPFAAGKIRRIENGYDPDTFFRDETVHAQESCIDKRNEVLSLLTDGYSKCNISGEQLIQTDRLVTFVGKYADYKGIDALINAMPLIVNGMKKENHTVHFLILGAGELEDSLRELVQVRGLERSVTFCGFQTEEMVNKAHNISDVSVVPSRQEPFGLAALEGLASGHPVVATNVGGLAEILDPAGRVSPSGGIEKTRFGFLTTPVPERLTLTGKREAEECNILMSECLYANNSVMKEQTIKKLPFGSETTAGVYLKAYAESVSNLAEAVIRTLSDKESFDPAEIAAYTQKHFSISGISRKLISLFETIIMEKGESNDEKPDGHELNLNGQEKKIP